MASLTQYDYDLIVHQCEGQLEVTVLVSVCFGVQCPVAPIRRENLEQVLSTV